MSSASLNPSSPPFVPRLPHAPQARRPIASRRSSLLPALIEEEETARILHDIDTGTTTQERLGGHSAGSSSPTPPPVIRGESVTPPTVDVGSLSPDHARHPPHIQPPTTPVNASDFPAPIPPVFASLAHRMAGSDLNPRAHPFSPSSSPGGTRPARDHVDSELKIWYGTPFNWDHLYDRAYGQHMPDSMPFDREEDGEDYQGYQYEHNDAPPHNPPYGHAPYPDAYDEEDFWNAYVYANPLQQFVTNLSRFSPFRKPIRRYDAVKRILHTHWPGAENIRLACIALHNRVRVPPRSIKWEYDLTRPIVTTAIERDVQGRLQLIIRLWRWNGKSTLRADGKLHIQQWKACEPITNDTLPMETLPFADHLPDIAQSLENVTQFIIAPAIDNSLMLSIRGTVDVTLQLAGSDFVEPLLWASICQRIATGRKNDASKPFNPDLKLADMLPEMQWGDQEPGPQPKSERTKRGACFHNAPLFRPRAAHYAFADMMRDTDNAQQAPPAEPAANAPGTPPLAPPDLVRDVDTPIGSPIITPKNSPGTDTTILTDEVEPMGGDGI